jgi:hypothetical protein
MDCAWCAKVNDWWQEGGNAAVVDAAQIPDGDGKVSILELAKVSIDQALAAKRAADEYGERSGSKRVKDTPPAELEVIMRDVVISNGRLNALLGAITDSAEEEVWRIGNFFCEGRCDAGRPTVAAKDLH